MEGLQKVIYITAIATFLFSVTAGLFGKLSPVVVISLSIVSALICVVISLYYIDK